LSISATANAPALGAAIAADSTPLLATHPGKRAAERFYLAYTPVWGAITGVVMLTGLAERWHDRGLMALGVVLFAGALYPLLRPAPEERGIPLRRRYAFKLLLWLTIYSFLANFFGTSFFYEALHAHYGFDTHINVNGVPVFLGFMTVVYFSTYVVLINVGWRIARDRLMPRSKLAGWAFAVALPFAVAGLESALNANPWMGRLYCFDDRTLALTFGTFAYGTWLAIAMPFWVTLDERPGDDVPLRRVVIGSLAAAALLYADAQALERFVAPHFTQVAWGHVGLSDFGGGNCLGGIR